MPKATLLQPRDPRSTRNDLLLMYTDGLAEARNGEQLFGEERVASQLRRDPGVAPDVLCKTLLEAARDFSSGADHRRRRHPRHPARLSGPSATDARRPS